MTRPSVILFAGVGCLLLIAIALRHRGSDSELAAPSAQQLARTTGSEHAGWNARAGTGDGASADGSGAPRGFGRQTAPGAGGGRGQGTANNQDGGSTSGGTASVIRGGSRPHGGTVGTGWGGGNQHGSGSIEVNGSVKPAEVPFEGALNSPRNRDGAMHGGTEQRVVRSVDAEPNSGETAQTKDEVTGEDGMVLKVGVDKNTQGQAQDTGPKPVVEDGVTYSGDGMHFATDAQFVVPNAGNLKGEAGTVSLTLTPDWGGDDPDLASLMQLRGTTWENRLQLFKDGHFLRVLLTPDTGVEAGVGIDISQWPPGEPQHIATTWGETDTGERYVALYLNGQLMGRAPYQGDLNISGNDLRIGSDHPGQQVGARGAINDFKGFDHPLTPDRIAALAAPQ